MQIGKFFFFFNKSTVELPDMFMRKNLCRFLGLAGFMAALSSITLQADPMDRRCSGQDGRANQCSHR